MNRLAIMFLLVPALCTGFPINKVNRQAASLVMNKNSIDASMSASSVQYVENSQNQQFQITLKNNQNIMLNNIQHPSQNITLHTVPQSNQNQQLQASKNQKTTSQVPKLTQEFLAGVWVDEHGFVCEYNKKDLTFAYDFDTFLTACEVSKDGIEGYNFGRLREEIEKNKGKKDDSKNYSITQKIKIKVVNQDAIQMNGKTAYRASSKKGKAYTAKIKEQLIGDWRNFDHTLPKEISYKISKNKLTYSNPEKNEKSSSDYTFDQSLLTIKDPRGEEIYQVQIKGDCLTWSYNGKYALLYRKDSKAYKEQLTIKSHFLEGKWFFRDSDRYDAQLWVFHKDKLTYKDITKNAKSKTVTYEIKCEKDEVCLKVNGKKYTVYGLDDPEEEHVTLYTSRHSYYLIPYDSEQGKEFQRRAKIFNRDGSEKKQTYSYEWQDATLKKVKVNLTGKNNIILEDEIYINNSFLDICDSTYITGFQVEISEKFKDVSVTMKYDASKLQYDCEDDLAIVYCKDDKRVLLDTTINKKYHTATAAYYEDGDYFLVDRYLFEGKQRDPSTMNIENSQWARTQITGDILKMVDWEYLKKSNGQFKVSTPEQLASVVFYVNTMNANADIELENDIDLSGYDWAPIGFDAYYAKCYFTGSFNGNHHTIRGMVINENGSVLGLIGCERGCTVKDLALEGAYVTGGYDSGILVGEALGGTFTNCTVSGVTKGNNSMGTMFGYVENAVIKDCKSDVIVNGEQSNRVCWLDGVEIFGGENKDK